MTPSRPSPSPSPADRGGGCGSKPRSAFTLLEVILALVILGGSVAVLGEIMRLANQSAVDAATETRAQAIAASAMDELLAGAVAMEEGSREPLEVGDDSTWVVSTAFLPCEVDGLQLVEVTVEQDLETGIQPTKYRLVRWMPIDPAAAEADEMAESIDSESEADGA